MKRHSPCIPRLTLLFGLVVVLGASACRSARAPAEAGPGPWWDVDRHEILSWRADRPEFGQDHALEASGLAATRQYQCPSASPERSMLFLPDSFIS